MNLYTANNIKELTNDLGFFSINVEDTDTYFDGYAQVYDATVSYQNEAGDWTDFEAVITHEALCFHHYGEE